MFVSAQGLCRRLLSAAVLLLVCSAGIIASEIQSFDLAGGDADLTLKQFAKQARSEIVYDPQSVKGIQTREVVGLFEPRNALERMLESTPLVFQQDLESGAFAVTRSEIPSPNQTTQNTEPRVSAETEINAKKNNWVKALAAVLTLGIVTGQPEVKAQKENEGSIVELERFEVRGYRASFAKAINTKRTSENIIDGVSAEDIGKLPDTNIAEALQRVTGVQIQRDGGEGTFVSIRGLHPTFTKVTLNGQSITPSRTQRFGQEGFNLSIVPPNIANSLEVIKSPSANMDEGGIGGTVNITKIRPLDLGSNRYSATGQLVHDSLRDTITPHLYAFASNVFNDGRLGASIGGHFFRRRVQRQFVDGEDSPRGLGGTDFIYQERVRAEDRNQDNDDYGLSATLQFRPNDTLELYVDSTFSKRDYDVETTQFQFGFRDGEINESDTRIAANADNHLTTVPLGDFRGLRYLGRAMIGDDKLFTLLGGANWGISDTFSLTIEAAYSLSQQFGTDTILFPALFNGGDFDLTPNDPDDTIALVHFATGDRDYSGVGFEDISGLYDFSNPSNYELGRVGSGLRELHTEGEDQSIKAFAVKDYESFALEFGLKFTEVTERQDRFRNVIHGEIRDEITSKIIAAGNRIIKENHATSLIEGIGPTPFLETYDFGLKNKDPSQLDFFSDGVDDQYFAQRDIFASYLMAGFDQVWNTVPASGNVGIRLVKDDSLLRGFGESLGSSGSGITRVPVDGQGNVLGGFTLVEENRDYTKVLPSLNLKFDLRENFVTRFAAARVMRRPEIRDQTPYFELDFDLDPITEEIDFTSGGSGDNGNPDLVPFLANQLDLSFEYYTGDFGLLALGLFYKDVENFIDAEEIYERMIPILGPDGVVRDVAFEVTQAVNGGGASVQGIELTMQRDFRFLNVEGFGASLNFTFTESEADSDGQSLPGTSKGSGNAILFYENDTFGLRAAYNYRSRFRTGTTDYRHSIRSLEGSAYYQLNERLKMQLSFVNVFKFPYHRRFRGSGDFAVRGLSVDDISTNWTSYNRAGRQIYLGASMSY